MIVGVKSADADSATEIEQGHHVRGFFAEINFSAESISSTKIIHWKIVRKPQGAGQTSPSLYYQIDRRNILKRGMEMLPKDVGTVTKRIFMIKSAMIARIGDSDEIAFHYISTSTETVNVCGIFIFKETD